MSRQYFGTDGVRGPYGGPVVNEDFAWRLGVAAGWWLKAVTGTAGKVVIGRDTRASGVALAQAMADGLTHAGSDVVFLDVAPTPAVALAVRWQQASLGVVITASHNPAADNGIKFFGATGVKLTDDEEARIERLLPVARTNATAARPARVDAAAHYRARMEKLLPDLSLAGWKVVLDLANGATVQTSAPVLRHYHADVLAIGDRPDGANINAGIGSEHPEKMCAAVKQHGARLGIAHDGDGDRCILCDEQGEVLDGDEILTLLALHALQQGKLPTSTLVVTVQSNLGVDAAVTAAGGRISRTQVGDRYVIERMLAEGAMLGGESSGHVICAEIFPTGDGLVAALKVLEVMRATGKPLSELRRGLVKFPQRSAALRVREKKPLESLATLPAVMRAVEKDFGRDGRVLVRYSGTEPKLRLLVEGPTAASVDAALDRLAAAARHDLDVEDPA